MIAKKNDGHEIIKENISYIYVLNTVFDISLKHSCSYFIDEKIHDLNTIYKYANKLILLKHNTNPKLKCDYFLIRTTLLKIDEHQSYLKNKIVSDKINKLSISYYNISKALDYVLAESFKITHPLKNLTKSEKALRNQKFGQYFIDKKIAGVFEYDYFKSINENEDNKKNITELLKQIDILIYEIFAQKENSSFYQEIKRLLLSIKLDEKLQTPVKKIQSKIVKI